MENRLGAASRYCGLRMRSGGIETMSTPARSAASASSRVITLSMVSWRLPFMARRSATVGRLRLIGGVLSGSGVRSGGQQGLELDGRRGELVGRGIGAPADRHFGQADV